MKTDLPKLNQKTLTKLINSKYRKSLLSKLNLKKTFGLSEYAQYVVDSSIMQKIPEYEDNAKSGWGFPQLNIICSIKKDGTIEKMEILQLKLLNAAQLYGQMKTKALLAMTMRKLMQNQ